MGVIKANILDEYRKEIVNLAFMQYHKKYVHGTMGPDTFDCAGMVWYIYYSLLGIDIFSGGYGMSTTTMIMTSKYGILTLFSGIDKDISLINKGDIVLLHRQAKNDYEPRKDNKYPGHCGIYIGNNSFIHASGTEKSVVISNFDNEYWKNILVGSKDIVSTLVKK